jgi:hypothetical protein
MNRWDKHQLTLVLDITMKDSSKDIHKYKLWLFLICVPFLLLLIFYMYNIPLRAYGIERVTQINLYSTYKAILAYLEENGKYPSSENWQDLLLPYLDNDKDAFKSPSKVKTINTIAINPKAEPNSPSDVVLLFESTGGWNAHGQSELLAPTSNGKPGCFISFNKGRTKFISPEQVKDLNWGNKP